MSTFPPPVPKPASAGNAITAIANTTTAYVNIRNGPGTQYRDVGDVHNFTLLLYYPNSRTNGDWVWIEQFGVKGWVSSSLIQFERADASPPPAQAPTPYDGKVAIWHWRGDSIGESSIDQVAQTIKTNAPHVKALFVKTSDYTASTGPQWMGYWDSKRNLAIDGPSSIDRWVTTLAKYNLEFHAWCVPRGADINAETNLIIQACQRPGVKSMILDVEPYDGFWLGGRAAIRPFMTRIRRALPGSFHIGMSIDPRPRWYDAIYPAEWFPFVNSIHPQDYWETFRQTPDQTLDSTWQVWGSYGRPIIPVLQGDASDASSIRQAHTLATQRYKATGVSWWRLGVIGPGEFAALNQPINLGTTPTVPTTPPEEDQYLEEQVVRPQDPGFSIWSHTGQREVETFQGTWGWQVYYKQSEPQTSKVAARWSPVMQNSGKYEITTFVPARHSTTKNARYKIHGVRGTTSEVIVSVDQSKQRNTWVKLGIFDFDKNAINAGVVFLNDLTGESDLEIAFDAVRWRRIAPPGSNAGIYSDGFDPPIGTTAERRSSQVWPGRWLDASPFGRLYFIGTPSEAYHTGADLNLPSDADAHTPVYACASGVVVFAARLPTWGNVIVIRHDPRSRTDIAMHSRYGHVEDVVVKVGDRVSRGQRIAKVGNAFGRFAYHLHFDLSTTNILETNPEHWPGRNLTELLQNYVDPRMFIEANRPG